MFPLHDDNPTAVVPYVTYTVLAICIAVFLWQVSHDAMAQQVIIHALGVIPAVLFGNVGLPAGLDWVSPVTTVFSSLFLHGGWMHLVGNVLYLWVFGNNVEAAMGHVRFAFFYLICGGVAVLAQALPDTHSQIPMIGASGAISGVLGAYMLLYPQARVLVLIPVFFFIQVVRVPALLVLGIWFLMQLANSLLSVDQEGGVAFGAHLGGFVAGMVLIRFFKHSNLRLHLPFGYFDPSSRWRNK